MRITAAEPEAVDARLKESPQESLVDIDTAEPAVHDSSSPIPAMLPEAAPAHAFCITLYNEGPDAFAATILSILESVAEWHSGKDPASGSATLCILADGRQCIDPRILELLVRCRMTTRAAVHEDDDAESYSTFHRIDQLIQRLRKCETPPARSTQRVHVLVYLKKRNKGKLDSHAVFFDQICRDLQPRYCYQVDAGTLLAPSAVRRITEWMDGSTQTGALAPRVIPALPGPGDRFLVMWQFTDLAYRNSVSWPAETGSGFLSVIPGQTGVFRWAALQSAAGAADIVVSYVTESRRRDSLTTIMYLAEDRVIGRLLFLAQRTSWNLKFLPMAAVTTDVCETWTELLRQRRRWNNSALACRIRLMADLPGFLRRRDRDRAEKRVFSMALIVQSLIALREFAAPAQLLGLVAALCTVSTGPGGISFAALIGFSVTTLVDVALALGNQPDRYRRFFGWLSGFFLLALVWTAFPPLAAALLTLPSLVFIPFHRVLPPDAFGLMIRAQLSPIPNLLMLVITHAYSFWKLDDVSWGTKGLTTNSGTACTGEQLKRLRYAVFGTWISFNLILVVIAFTQAGIFYPELNPVIEFACIVDSVLALLAIGATCLGKGVHRER